MWWGRVTFSQLLDLQLLCDDAINNPLIIIMSMILHMY